MYLPQRPLQRGNLLHQNQEGKESASKREITILYNLAIDVTSHRI